MQSKLPVLFVTHGSPMLAVEPGKTGVLLNELGQKLINHHIRAILVISAHWLSHGKFQLTAGEDLKTIHDFSGFPEQLYQLEYPAKGSTEIAKEIQNQLAQKGMSVDLDYQRGLDHGAWVPLQYLFPKAEFPVIELSIPYPMDSEQAIEMGQKIKHLRDNGILIVTSGSMTHNLYDAGYSNKEKSYIKPFTDWIRTTIKNYDLKAMAQYQRLAPYAKEAHPTNEHFLPLIIAMASSDKGELITEFSGGVTYEALAMDNYVFGQY